MVGEGIVTWGSKYAIRKKITDFTVKLGGRGMGMKVGLSMTMNDAPITHNS